MTVSISQWAYPEGGPPHVAVTTSPGVSSAVITLTKEDWLYVFQELTNASSINMIFPIGDIGGRVMTVDEFFESQAKALFNQLNDVNEVARLMGVNDNQFPRLKLICEMETNGQ